MPELPEVQTVVQDSLHIQEATSSIKALIRQEMRMSSAKDMHQAVSYYGVGNQLRGTSDVAQLRFLNLLNELLDL